MMRWAIGRENGRALSYFLGFLNRILDHKQVATERSVDIAVNMVLASDWESAETGVPVRDAMLPHPVRSESFEYLLKRARSIYNAPARKYCRAAEPGGNGQLPFLSAVVSSSRRDLAFVVWGALNYRTRGKVLK